MSGLKKVNKAHTVLILLGSNIEAERYIPQARELLRAYDPLVKFSGVYQTSAVGFSGHDFWNQIASLNALDDKKTLKETLIEQIETQLDRRRETNKFAPRTIDLDIIMFDREVTDTMVWDHDYILFPLSDLYPELMHPAKKLKLSEYCSGVDPKIAPVRVKQKNA